MTSKLSEALQVVSCIDADANAAGTFWGDAIDMADFHRILAILSVGVMESTATVDYALWSGTTSGGTYTAITSGSATQLTQADTDDDKQVVIELDARAVLAKGHRYVKDRLLITTDAVDSCSIVLGARARYEPEVDLTTVDEVVYVP